LTTAAIFISGADGCAGDASRPFGNAAVWPFAGWAADAAAGPKRSVRSNTHKQRNSTIDGQPPPRGDGATLHRRRFGVACAARVIARTKCDALFAGAHLERRSGRPSQPVVSHAEEILRHTDIPVVIQP